MSHRLRLRICICIAVWFTVAAVRGEPDPWEKYIEQVRMPPQKGHYAEAEKAALAAIAEAETSGHLDADLAKSWNTGRYVEAEVQLHRSLERNAEAVEVMGDLADLCRSQRRNTEAKSRYAFLIPVQETQRGREHRDVAGNLYVLASSTAKDGLHEKPSVPTGVRSPFSRENSLSRVPRWRAVSRRSPPCCSTCNESPKRPRSRRAPKPSSVASRQGRRSLQHS